ncbi:MAG: lysophospholipid acyltransferase family protein [Bdellovibrionales bacterium]
MQAIGRLLSYIRAPFLLVFGALYTIFGSILVILVAYATRSPRCIDFVCVDVWARVLLFFSGVKVEIRGWDNLQKSSKGFLILFNHSSHYDIPVLFCFPQSFRFGAKIELFKVPFFGKAMAACGALPIDRGNREKVMKVYENAIARVNKGEAFALAPEGTRQSEPKIGAFKRGPFEFAANAQMDLVPVVIAGAYEVLPKKSIWVNLGQWRRKVIMEILPRMPAAGLEGEELVALKDQVRTKMEDVFNRNHAEVYPV